MVKTDNHNPKAKLDLRRYFLRKYHADGPIHVLDCCQGSGLLWNQLRKEFEVATYWGVDVKPKKGRLKIDSTRILAQSGWPQNVVDVDTYGSPWKHWEAMLPNISQPTTVFLTVGQVSIGGSPLLKVAKEALGLKEIDVPNAIGMKLNALATDYLLAEVYQSDILLAEAVEARSDGSARYLGVHVVPNKAAGREAATSARPKHKQPVKEVAHV